MSIFLRAAILFIVPLVSFASDLKIEYRDLSSFTRLPEEVKDYFLKLGCRVPQIPDGYMGDNIANDNIPFVGDFSQSGQQDWAVLCSKDGVSSIVVKWGDKAHCKSEFGSHSDEGSWEGMAGGTRWYSRYVSGDEKSIFDEPYITKGVYTKYSCENGNWIQENLGGH